MVVLLLGLWLLLGCDNSTVRTSDHLATKHVLPHNLWGMNIVNDIVDMAITNSNHSTVSKDIDDTIDESNEI